MTFKAQIEEARRQVELAKAEHGRATRALQEAAERLGALTGVYHGLATYDDASSSMKSRAERPPADAVRDLETRRQKAPKGAGKRRVAEIVRQHDGISKDDIEAEARRSGDPISNATLRRALSELAHEGRIKQEWDLWYSTGATAKTDSQVDVEAAGTPWPEPAASDSNHDTKEDRNGPALAS